MRRFNPDSLACLARRIAAGFGVPEPDAALLADALIDADLHGAATHGISRLNIYMRRIQNGLIDPKADLIVRHPKPGALVVDANNGLGQVQAVKTLNRLVPLARQHGVAVATVRQSQHFGALSYYCNRAASQDMILLATTSCEPAMSPAGGYDAFFGTNPIAVSFPTDKGFPIKIDLATSVIARGNIIAANKEGRPIPEDWALCPNGSPTIDPAQALLGTVLTMAGHKGYALALMVEVLSSVLSGSAVGPDIGSMYKDMDRKQDVGHFFCLININAFLEITEFKRRIGDMIGRIKAGRKRQGVEEILVPGERSAHNAERNQREGIMISDAILDELRTLSDDIGVTFELVPLREAKPCPT